MSTPKPNPRVGVAALVRGPHGHLVFGRRKGTQGAGSSSTTPLPCCKLLWPVIPCQGPRESSLYWDSFGAQPRLPRGRRLTNSAFSKGKWAFPGGHLEHGETFFECAERETLEETGLVVKGLKVLNVTNDVFKEAGKHYITLFVVCEMVDPEQTPQVSNYYLNF